MFNSKFIRKAKNANKSYKLLKWGKLQISVAGSRKSLVLII